jgi:O-antigen/teichoic acid export membrane protein
VSQVSTRLLARSSLYANVAEVWQMASRLVLTPVVLGALGLEGYGSWTLLFTLCSYGFMLSAGFGVVVSKLTAEFDRHGEGQLLSESLGTGMAVLGAVGLVLLALLWGASRTVLEFLNVPAALVGDAARALLFVGVAVEVRLVAGVTLFVLAGLQRADLQYRLGMFGSMVEFCLALSLVLAGYGLPGLGVAFLVGETTAVSCAWLLCKRLRPGLILSPLRASRRGLSRIAALSAQLQALLFLNTLFSQAVRLILSTLLGVGSLGSFSLGERIVRMAETPATSILGPLVPAFASLEAGAEHERWGKLFERASRAVAIAAVVPLLFVSVYAQPILFAWTSTVDPQAALAVRILALGEAVSLLTGVGTASLRAAGAPRFEIDSKLAGGVLALAGAALAGPLGGFMAIVAALAFGRSLGALWFLWRFARLRGIALRDSILLLVRPAVLLGAVSAGVFGLCAFLPTPTATGRWVVAAEMGLLALATAIVAALAAWFLILTRDEKRTAVGLVPRRGSG